MEGEASAKFLSVVRIHWRAWVAFSEASFPGTSTPRSLEFDFVHQTSGIWIETFQAYV
jgi:hypothetical protein